MSVVFNFNTSLSDFVPVSPMLFPFLENIHDWAVKR